LFIHFSEISLAVLGGEVSADGAMVRNVDIYKIPSGIHNTQDMLLFCRRATNVMTKEITVECTDVKSVIIVDRGQGFKVSEKFFSQKAV